MTIRLWYEITILFFKEKSGILIVSKKNNRLMFDRPTQCGTKSQLAITFNVRPDLCPNYLKEISANGDVI